MLVVTGDGGFIGSALCAALNEAGRDDLVIVDRFGRGDKWRNIAKRDFFEIVPPAEIGAWLERWDAVSRTSSGWKRNRCLSRRCRRNPCRLDGPYLSSWRRWAEYVPNVGMRPG